MRRSGVNYPWLLPAGPCQQVRLLVRRRDYGAAVSELERLGNLGSRSAQAALAYLYLRGTSVTPADFNRATRLASPGAVAGYPYAQYVMGWLALLGDKDAVAASKWWVAAAMQGFGPAALEIGKFLLTDHPEKPPKVKEAQRYFRLAEQSGHRLAGVVRARAFASGVAGMPRAIAALLVFPIRFIEAAIWVRVDPFGERVFTHVEAPSRDLFT